MPIPRSDKDIADASPGAAMLERLRKGVDNAKLCHWPGETDDESRLWLVPLACDALEDAYAEAFARFDKLSIPVTAFTASDWNSEITLCILARAMRVYDKDDPKDRSQQLFTDADEFRSLIEPEGRDALATHWLELSNKTDPDPASMDPELLDKIDEFVKKKDARALSALPSSILSAYIIGMADQLHS